MWEFIRTIIWVAFLYFCLQVVGAIKDAVAGEIDPVGISHSYTIEAANSRNYYSSNALTVDGKCKVYVNGTN